MQRARVFFYVSLGILALVGAFHLGSARAYSQGGVSVASITGTSSCPIVVVATNGDVYEATNCDLSSWTFRGNVFGGAVQANETTWAGSRQIGDDL